MMSQNDRGDQSSTTRSAIGAGTINITNQGAQTQDVASLSRDTTSTNGKVSNTPDVNNLLSQQADTMQAAQAAGQVVAQGIGMYADHERKTATDAATAAAWDEGGNNRALLQAAGGALIGGLGGGSIFTAVGGAAGAAIASKAAKGIADIENGVTSGTGSQVIGNLAGNIAAGLGGALVGGTAGAATGSAVQLYNQSMDDEAQLTGNSKSSSPFSQSPLDLVLQGIRNGLGAIVGMGGAEPPATSAQGVLVNGAAQATPGAANSLPANALLSDGGGNGRPSARQSEIDVGSDLGSSADPQVSYKNGQQVSYGTSGSVRPDYAATDGSASFEVKNYNISTNSSGLINNVATQAMQRQANLPDGMQQQVIIDTRGQTVTDSQINNIVQGIVTKSNGIIQPGNILFK
ncbi:hypothetical protein [Paraburkholderia aspalathi]|uniref:hypothetical protein n=1 Tax=Paraburkholderia aspalathi TaxID=1324617 RepID=UPI00190BA3DF